MKLRGKYEARLSRFRYTATRSRARFAILLARGFYLRDPSARGIFLQSVARINLFILPFFLLRYFVVWKKLSGPAASLDLSAQCPTKIKENDNIKKIKVDTIISLAKFMTQPVIPTR